MKTLATATRAARCGVLAIGVMLVSACSSDDQPNAARNVGTVTMALSTTAGENSYRLQAVFVISGAQGDITLSTSADEPSLSTQLPAGSYSAFLQSFTLYKDDGTGIFDPVAATLESSTEPFTVFDNSTTTVHFQFDINPLPSDDADQCTGAGLVHSVSDDCMNDGGLSGGGDELEVYCVAGRARFCLTHEGCPWRSALIDTAETCSRAGLSPAYPTYLASAWCDLWAGKQYYECDLSGQIFFPDQTSGPYPNP